MLNNSGSLKKKYFACLCGLTILAFLLAPLSRTVNAEAVYIIPTASGSTPANVLKHSKVTWHGDNISKPVCPASSPLPQIFVYPVHMLGQGASGHLYGITAVNAYAADHDTYWQVLAEIRIENGAYYADNSHVRVIAQVWCCKNADCYDY